MLTLNACAPVLVRLGVCGVVLWFGLNQLASPGLFVGYVPGWARALAAPEAFVRANGAFETVFGLLLLLGAFTRAAALMLALHLAGITVTVGYNEIGARDFAITLAASSIVCAGPDAWSLDRRLLRSKFRRTGLGRIVYRLDKPHTPL